MSPREIWAVVFISLVTVIAMGITSSHAGADFIGPDVMAFLEALVGVAAMVLIAVSSHWNGS